MPDEPTYTGTQVARAAGVPRVTLDVWMTRDYLGFDTGPGSGRARVWTEEMVMRVATMAGLVALHIPPQMSGQIARSIEWPIDPVKSILVIPQGERIGALMAWADIAAGDSPGAAIRGLGAVSALFGGSGPACGYNLLDLAAVKHRVDTVFARTSSGE